MTTNQILIVMDRYRARNKMRVEDVCKRAGITKSAYTKWLTGETTPQHAKLEAVLDAMGLEFSIRRKKEDGNRESD